MPYGPKTENETLRERLDWAQSELRRIDVETALAAVARRDEIAAEEAAKQLAAQRAAEAAELEEYRQVAWVGYRIEECHKAKNPNDAFIALMSRDPRADTPLGVWPPGDGPENYRTTVASLPTSPDPKVENTRLGVLLKERLSVKI